MNSRLSTSHNIKLYENPPATTDVGAAYARLAVGLAQKIPPLLPTYLGPAEWPDAVLADPPSLDRLRAYAVALATAVQKSGLPRRRRERLLRNVRALLWLIRALADEQIIFSEQVRLLLDLKPESVDPAFFETAHDSLAQALPGSEPLADRWAEWQARHTISGQAARPLLVEVLETVRERFGPRSLLTSQKLKIVEAAGDGSPFYQPGQLHLPRAGPVRVDRLYHLAVRWGYGGLHSFYSALAERYQVGEVECAVCLNMGPDQVIVQGLPAAVLAELDLYPRAISHLLQAAGLADHEAGRLQVIHTAEDMLQWGVANAALLLHAENLRPRAIRRRLMTNALLPRDRADRLLEELSDPIQAAHVFAPLIGGPLIKTWLAQTGAPVSILLADPPPPSTMVSELRFGT